MERAEHDWEADTEAMLIAAESEQANSGRGLAPQGQASPGLALSGKARNGSVRPAAARLGEAGIGMASHGFNGGDSRRTGDAMVANGKATAVGPEVSNGAAETIELSEPYVVDVTIQGTADLLFHRWNCEAVEAKAKAAKGSKAKKEDNIESYVYRNDDNQLCLPGEYVRQAVIHAAKFRQDPRSPRKSAMDLYKAAIVPLTVMAPLSRNDSAPLEAWDYEHKCRVMVQRNGITRVRPALKVGWECTVQMMVNVPEYIRPQDLHDVLNAAGRLIGVGDFRPTYGRFLVKSFDVGLS